MNTTEVDTERWYTNTKSIKKAKQKGWAAGAVLHNQVDRVWFDCRLVEVAGKVVIYANFNGKVPKWIYTVEIRLQELLYR